MPEFLSIDAMRAVVTHAISEFARHDMALLHVKVQEETLAHRVAVYIERHLQGWHVDCEYNRNLRRAKMRADGNSRMRPDIIAHIRNSPENLLVVEIKKATHSKRNKTEAEERVREFTGKWTTHPRYCHGAILIFPVRESDPKQVTCSWFYRNGCGQYTGGEPSTFSGNVSLEQGGMA